MTVDARTRITEWAATAVTSAGQADSTPEELLPLVYNELRHLAGRLMARERREHTLNATALVHEAYLRLIDQSRVDWKGRSHFMAVGAEAMRRLLVDHARGHGRVKRGAGWQRVSLGGTPAVGAAGLGHEDLLSLHSALKQLTELDPRQARVVELRYFGGLSTRETAAVLGVSPRTVEGDWTHARAWLRRSLSGRAES